MKNYLHLILRLKVDSKLQSFSNFFPFLKKLRSPYFVGLIFLFVLFRALCSVVTIVVLAELLAFFKLEPFLAYLTLLLLYLFSRENTQDNEKLLQKLLPLFRCAPLTQKEFGKHLLLVPSLVDLFLKLDVILPFIVYTVITLKFLGGVLVVWILLGALLRNIRSVMVSSDTRLAKRTLLRHFFSLVIGLIIVDRGYYLALLTFKEFEHFLTGSLNKTFIFQLRSLFLDFSFEHSIFVGALAIFCFVTININDLLQNLRCLAELYEPKTRENLAKSKVWLSDLILFKHRSFTTIERLYLKYLEQKSDSLSFLTSIPEVFIIYYLLYLICEHTNDLWVNLYIIVTFFIIENANIVNSFVIQNQNVFRNYVDISNLSYWKLSKYGIKMMYLYKKELLVKLVFPFVWLQLGLSYLISLLVMPALLSSILHIIFLLGSSKLTEQHAKLSLFMTPYIFSKNYALLKNMDKTEAEYTIYARIYNFYKVPLVLLTLVPLVLQLVIDILGPLTFLGALCLFGGYYFYLNREEELLLDKGEVEYEKI